LRRQGRAKAHLRIITQAWRFEPAFVTPESEGCREREGIATAIRKI